MSPSQHVARDLNPGTADAMHEEAFNVVRPRENYRVRELAEIIHHTTFRLTWRNYCVGCSKSPRSLPSFVPRWMARKVAPQAL